MALSCLHYPERPLLRTGPHLGPFAMYGLGPLRSQGSTESDGGLMVRLKGEKWDCGLSDLSLGSFRQRVQVLSYDHQSLVRPWTSPVKADMLSCLSFPFLLWEMKIPSSRPTRSVAVGMGCEGTWCSATPTLSSTIVCPTRWHRSPSRCPVVSGRDGLWLTDFSVQMQADIDSRAEILQFK